MSITLTASELQNLVGYIESLDVLKDTYGLSVYSNCDIYVTSDLGDEIAEIHVGQSGKYETKTRSQ